MRTYVSINRQSSALRSWGMMRVAVRPSLIGSASLDEPSGTCERINDSSRGAADSYASRTAVRAFGLRDFDMPNVPFPLSAPPCLKCGEHDEPDSPEPPNKNPVPFLITDPPPP